MSLKAIVDPEFEGEIPEECFENNRIESVCFSRATAIGPRAFFDSCLKKIDAPCVERIAAHGLAHCDVAQVQMPNLKKIGAQAFHYCASLRSVVTGDSPEVAFNAFEGCHSLPCIHVPRGSLHVLEGGDAPLILGNNVSHSIFVIENELVNEYALDRNALARLSCEELMRLWEVMAQPSDQRVKALVQKYPDVAIGADWVKQIPEVQSLRQMPMTLRTRFHDHRIDGFFGYLPLRVLVAQKGLMTGRSVEDWSLKARNHSSSIDCRCIATAPCPIQ